MYTIQYGTVQSPDEPLVDVVGVQVVHVVLVQLVAEERVELDDEGLSFPRFHLK